MYREDKDVWFHCIVCQHIRRIYWCDTFYDHFTDHFQKHKLPKRHQFGLYLYALAICSILMSTDTPSLYQLNFDPQFNFIPFMGSWTILIIICKVSFSLCPSACCFPHYGNNSSRRKKFSLYVAVFLFNRNIAGLLLCQYGSDRYHRYYYEPLGSAVGYCVFLLIKNMRFMKRMHSKTNNPQRKTCQTGDLYLFLYSLAGHFPDYPFISNAIWDIIWDSAIGMPL